ncbi:MAG: RagB/SusD family nutrient uptake outer membrane protein [Chitinophagaceae bacterium]|nr:MAG: RagB/SusD family nutrient uptake outer membrane protein [Chitinophagaceae bacterium]
MQRIFFIVFLCVSLMACRKFIEPGEPNNQLTSGSVFSSDATATSAMLGIYAEMEQLGFWYNLSVLTGLSADEMINYNPSTDRIDVFTNNLSPENEIITALWNDLYTTIYRCNSVLKGLENSQSITRAVNDQLQGEALFLRAYCHFYLVQLYGEIPLILTTDYQANAGALRESVPGIYKQLEKDLQEAIQLLSPVYIGPSNQPTEERTRPNQFAALALLSRIYLFEGKWSMAESAATLVIDETSQYGLVSDLSGVFLQNSREALWQLEPKFEGANTYAGAMFPFTELPANISIDPEIIDSFAAGDQRSDEWFRRVNIGGVDYYYAFKYRVGQNVSGLTEYTMALRLAEVYLIRAESRAMQSNPDGASADINLIRERAGLSAVSIGNTAGLLNEIGHQRRFELFAESGDRWIDLRRTKSVDNVMSVAKGSDWTLNDQLYPIPQNDRNRNPLLSQNPGY